MDKQQSITLIHNTLFQNVFIFYLSEWHGYYVQVQSRFYLNLLQTITPELCVATFLMFNDSPCGCREEKRI